CAQRPEQIAARQRPAALQLFESRVTWLCHGGDLPFGSWSLPLPGSTHDQTTCNRVRLNGMRWMGPRSAKIRPQNRLSFQAQANRTGAPASTDPEIDRVDPAFPSRPGKNHQRRSFSCFEGVWYAPSSGGARTPDT